MKDISGKISDIGSKMDRMDIKKNIFQDLNLSDTERRSNIEDADMAEAVMNVSAAQLTYQAALSSSSKVMSLSLVDYLS